MKKLSQQELSVVGRQIAELVAEVDTDNRGDLFMYISEHLGHMAQYATAAFISAVGDHYGVSTAYVNRKGR